MSTATIAGRSGAASTSANVATTRTRISSPCGCTNAATQPRRQPSTPASQRSDDMQFLHGSPGRNAFVAEQRQVERDKAAVHDQLGDSAAGGRRLLQPVT